MVAQYAYDAVDNRISKTEGADTPTYTYDIVSDSQNLLTQTDGLGTTYHVYGVGLIGSELPSGDYITYHYDVRGSTTAITNASGEVTDRYIYSPYGSCTEHVGDTQSSFLYNGQYGVVDDGNGLIHMRACYYSPELMRFINADVLKGSLEDSRSLNRYAYANGNPVSFLDPFSLSATIAQVLHTFLDLAGLFPGVGAIFDIINGLWYALEGDWVNAGLSFASAVPGLGDAVGIAKLAVKGAGVVATAAHGAATTSSMVFVGGKAADAAGDAKRVFNITKSESSIWKEFGGYRDGIKTSGSGSKKQYYEWDYTHNDIEVYDHKGNAFGLDGPNNW